MQSIRFTGVAMPQEFFGRTKLATEEIFRVSGSTTMMALLKVDNARSASQSELMERFQ